MGIFAGAFVGLCSGLGDTIFVNCMGTFDASCASVGASSWFPVPLERTVYPQVVSLDLFGRSSKYFYHYTLFLGHLFRYLP